MKKNERGAYLVMMALLIVVLIGIAALAIDVGRLLVMKTEMQNAVDAAALAAAAELDGKSGAQASAKTAARTLLTEHQARFAKDADLLDGINTLPDSAFEFFCIIGSEMDHDGSDSDIRSRYCNGAAAPVESGKVVANNDETTRYVRVTLDPTLSGVVQDHFTADLIFLPVLRLLGINAQQTASVAVSALAGRNSFTCNYPPMVMCDPFEPDGQHFRDEVSPGQSILMWYQKGKWAAGNFGFLSAPGDTGGKDLQDQLANHDLVGCSPSEITTKPGNNVGNAWTGLNTRFDLYEGSMKESDSDRYPPAPNIVDYVRSATDPEAYLDNIPEGERLGDGNWDVEQYWLDQHGESPSPWSGTTPLRWDVYRHELDIPNNGISPDMPTDGTPTHTAGDYKLRRVFNLAVVSCEALGVKGNVTVQVSPADGFAEVFLLGPAIKEGSDGFKLYGEYLGWVFGNDGDNHITVKLYE